MPLGGSASDSLGPRVPDVSVARRCVPQPLPQGKWPLDSDCAKLLQTLDGPFGFCITDTREGYVFIARSAGGECPVYWGVRPD